MQSRPIGTTFKKENVFLATVDVPGGHREVPNLPKEISRFLFTQEYDIFYKDEKGYTRFLMEGNETFAGNGLDGKGFLYNIVSAWKYYKEEDLCETTNSKGEECIASTIDPTEDPIEQYNLDYNRKR